MTSRAIISGIICIIIEIDSIGRPSDCQFEWTSGAFPNVHTKLILLSIHYSNDVSLAEFAPAASQCVNKVLHQPHDK